MEHTPFYGKQCRQSCFQLPGKVCWHPWYPQKQVGLLSITIPVPRQLYILGLRTCITLAAAAAHCVMWL